MAGPNKTLAQIRAELDAANPVFYRLTSEGKIPLPAEERDARLDAWAQSEFDRQIANALPTARAQMAAVLDALPLDVQASLWATRVAVEQALDRGRLDIARQIVLDTAVPEELAAVKTQILNLFPTL